MASTPGVGQILDAATGGRLNATAAGLSHVVPGGEFAQQPSFAGPILPPLMARHLTTQRDQLPRSQDAASPVTSPPYARPTCNPACVMPARSSPIHNMPPPTRSSPTTEQPLDLRTHHRPSPPSNPSCPAVVQTPGVRVTTPAVTAITIPPPFSTPVFMGQMAVALSNVQSVDYMIYFVRNVLHPQYHSPCIPSEYCLQCTFVIVVALNQLGSHSNPRIPVSMLSSLPANQWFNNNSRN